MHTLICLLLLFLTSFSITDIAVGGTITTEFKVVNGTSPLDRRADIIFTCPLNEKKEDYILEVKKSGESAKIIIKFSGKGIKLTQRVNPGESVNGVRLSKIDPLLGETGEIKDIKLQKKDGIIELEINNLQPGFYQLSYTIEPLTENKIFSPQVIISNGKTKSQKFLEFRIPIFFKPGEYTINEMNAEVLRGIKPLKNFCNIKIIGYANGTPVVYSKAKSNENLAKERALSVQKFLEEEK